MGADIWDWWKFAVDVLADSNAGSADTMLTHLLTDDASCWHEGIQYDECPADVWGVKRGFERGHGGVPPEEFAPVFCLPPVRWYTPLLRRIVPVIPLSVRRILIRHRCLCDTRGGGSACSRPQKLTAFQCPKKGWPIYMSTVNQTVWRCDDHRYDVCDNCPLLWRRQCPTNVHQWDSRGAQSITGHWNTSNVYSLVWREALPVSTQQLSTRVCLQRLHMYIESTRCWRSHGRRDVINRASVGAFIGKPYSYQRFTFTATPALHNTTHAPLRAQTTVELLLQSNWRKPRIIS